jgi:hypothetical protein
MSSDTQIRPERAISPLGFGTGCSRSIGQNAALVVLAIGVLASASLAYAPQELRQELHGRPAA